MEDIMKIVKSLDETGLLIKRISKMIEMKQNNKNVDFLLCHRYIRCYFIKK